jgi:beta-glucanase (GH16 family)
MRARTRRLTALGVIVAVLIGTLATLAFGVPSARQASSWRQVFFDNFNHGLSPSKWGRYSGQPGGDPGGWWAPSHVVVQRGVLRLETYRDRRFGSRWVSGGVSSAPALKQTYGKYEVRFRVDPGKGVAFVALLWPSRGGWPPEIDFAENGGETSGRDHMTATLHYGTDDSQLQRTVRGDFTRWHVLGVQWTPGNLVYTMDGRSWAAVTMRAVPNQPMELDLQTQAGTCGDASAPCPDRTTPGLVRAEIDWVRAYTYRAGSRG